MSATLTKKEKKALRKQMMQRKQELLAKHGSAGGRPGDSGAYRTFSDVKPNLPTYSPSKSKEPARLSKTTKAAKAAQTAKATKSRASWRDRVKPVVTAKTPPAPRPARKFKPKLATHTPTSAATSNAMTAVATKAPYASGELAPGVLQRSAARIESGAAKIASLRHWRPPSIPWHKLSADATAPAFGSLRTIVWPMRVCGLVALGGAVKLSLEAHSAGLSAIAAILVLGLGVAVAVGVLALAEISRVLHQLACRL